MRGDIPQAAFRLMQKLPVRTHQRPEVERKEAPPGGYRIRKGVSINGVEYASQNAAARALGIHNTSVIRMVERGEGHYVDRS